MPRIIQLVNDQPQIVDDDWTVVREPGALTVDLGASTVLPLATLIEMNEDAASRIKAAWISPDDDFEKDIPRLFSLDMIAVDFPTFRDGRGYSIAKLLRTRYGWKRELRAIGDVLRDQLNYMRRCGFDAFAVRADKDIEAALKSFSFYTVTYQGSVNDPMPLFRRRSDYNGT